MQHASERFPYFCIWNLNDMLVCEHESMKGNMVHHKISLFRQVLYRLRFWHTFFSPRVCKQVRRLKHSQMTDETKSTRTLSLMHEMLLLRWKPLSHWHISDSKTNWIIITEENIVAHGNSESLCKCMEIYALSTKQSLLFKLE